MTSLEEYVMKVKIATMLLVIVILLSSCQRIASGGNDVPAQQNVEYDGSFDNKNDVPHDLDIKKVSHLFDREYSLGHSAETTYGYYEYVQRWVDGFSTEDYTHSGNLVFTDYQTEQMIYLCGVPDCAHNNANCTSYIEFSKGMILIPD